MSEYVTIELSRKQVNTGNLVHNEKNNKDYAKILAPGGGVLFYPIDSIKIKDEQRVFFTRPAGTELQIRYSHRKEGVPDNAPNNEKYENITKVVKIEDLKEMYEVERKEYIENHGFVNMSVPTSWGKHFSVDGGKEYVSISIPYTLNGEAVYASFIVPSERFRASQKVEGMSYFGFPKKYHGNDGSETVDFTVTLKSSLRQPDGTYEDFYEEIPVNKLKEYVDAAVERSSVKDLFVSTMIIKKRVREFESSSGKKLASISVPNFFDENGKELFYSIVVPVERIKDMGDETHVKLSLFRKTPNGDDYTFIAKRSVPIEGKEGEYEEITQKITSTEVVQHFEDARERYRNLLQRTLADELREKEKHQSSEDAEYPRNIKKGHR